MEYAANDKIDGLLVKFLAGETTPDEQKEMLSWVESSEENLHYFHQVSLLWSESPTADKSIKPNENTAWNRLQAAIAKSGPSKPTLVIRLPWLRMIAIFLIIAGGALTVYFTNKSSHRDIQPIISYSNNQVKTDTLPDRSIVTLNKKAVLSYPAVFNENQRKVSLKGEAFFDITANKNKPFIIDVADIKVKVLGTSFNIKNSDTATEIIVSTGIVQVIRGNEILELTKGEQTTITAATGKLEKSRNTDQLFNYYVSHTFVCDNTPLWKLVEKLQGAYNVNITIARQELRATPLTVTFHDESLDTILGILSQTLLIKVSRNGDDIVLQ